MSQSYVLDPTGTSPNNLVSSDIFSVTPNSNTAIVPSAGMYFASSLIVKDSNTGALMTRNVDYICIELSGEMTGKYGQEINAALLWLGTNSTVSISLQYQCLGGGNAYNSAQLQELIQNTNLNSQQLEWSNILNKPNLYTPNNHVNMLSDIYGFEPVVYAIERLSNVISLGNTASYQALMDWITGQLTNANNPSNLSNYGSLLSAYQKGVNNQILALENLIREDTPYSNKTLYSLIDDSTIDIVSYTLDNNLLSISLNYIYLPNGFKLFWELDVPNTNIGNYYYPSSGSINAAIDPSANSNSSLNIPVYGPILFNTSLTFTALNTYSNNGIVITWYDLNNKSISNLSREATLNTSNEPTTINTFNRSYIDRRYTYGIPNINLFSLNTYNYNTSPDLLGKTNSYSTTKDRVVNNYGIGLNLLNIVRYNLTTTPVTNKESTSTSPERKYISLGANTIMNNLSRYDNIYTITTNGHVTSELSTRYYRP